MAKWSIPRLVYSLMCSLCVTLVGIEMFMWSIHDSSTWERVLTAVCLPVAAVASASDFLDSNGVYWASIIAGAALWWAGFYCLLWAVVKGLHTGYRA